MRKPAKTFVRIAWSDQPGSVSNVTKRGRMYVFHVPTSEGDAGGEHGTDSMQGVYDAAKAYGGVVERVPNPHYAQQRRAWEAYQLRRTLGGFTRW